jgi:hypothetical protein
MQEMADDRAIFNKLMSGQYRLHSKSLEKVGYPGAAAAMRSPSCNLLCLAWHGTALCRLQNRQMPRHAAAPVPLHNTQHAGLC